MEIDKNKVIFIISHKYYRGYDSYIEYYINNIQKFYKKALIIVVDNNSTYKNDIFDNLRKYENVVLLDNNIESKFELGAYTVGLNFLYNNNINGYDYIVCTQDNFIIKNKINFTEFYEKNITASTIVGCRQDPILTDYLNIHSDCSEVSIPILSKLNLNNNLDKISFCWCNSFVIAFEKYNQLLEYFKQIVIKIRWESCASERYMSRILWELNNNKNHAIDGDIRDVKYNYDCHSVNIYADVKSFFVKKVQNKNENTIDK